MTGRGNRHVHEQSGVMIGWIISHVAFANVVTSDKISVRQSWTNNIYGSGLGWSDNYHACRGRIEMVKTSLLFAEVRRGQLKHIHCQ